MLTSIASIFCYAVIGMLIAALFFTLTDKLRIFLEKPKNYWIQDRIAFVIATIVIVFFCSVLGYASVNLAKYFYTNLF